VGKKNRFMFQCICLLLLNIITHPLPYDWHGFISVSLIAGLICIERWSLPISRYGEGCVQMWPWELYQDAYYQ